MSPIEKLIASVPLTPTNTPPCEGLYSTHEGVLEIAGLRLGVHLLNDGRRVISGLDLDRLFGVADAIKEGA